MRPQEQTPQFHQLEEMLFFVGLRLLIQSRDVEKDKISNSSGCKRIVRETSSLWKRKADYSEEKG